MTWDLVRRVFDPGGGHKQAIAESELARELDPLSNIINTWTPRWLKRKEKAFELLHAAVQERSPRVAFLAVEPRLDTLRADPRFKELLRLVGL